MRTILMKITIMRQIMRIILRKITIMIKIASAVKIILFFKIEMNVILATINKIKFKPITCNRKNINI